MFAAFHQLMRLRNIFERKDRKNNWSYLAGFDERPDTLLQRCCNGRFFCIGSWAQDRIRDAETLHQNWQNIRINLRAAEYGNDDYSSVSGCELQVAGKVIAADHVEDHVNTTSMCGIFQHLNIVLFTIIDGQIGTKIFAGSTLFL